jgi:LysR family transcriptional regulator for bpeEF and oprC
MSHLRNITTFVQSARMSSFSKAALELALTPQAVSNQIKQLEELVGVQLFHRTTRKISLTEEGRIFYDHCSSGLDSIDEGLRKLNDAARDAIGTVRIAVNYAMGRGYVVPIVTRFMEKYPRISVELIVQNQTPDIVDQGVDLGITGRPIPTTNLIVRKIAEVELVLCATPEYLARRGVPQSMQDLKSHRCVVLRHPGTGKILPWTFQENGRTLTLTVDAALTANDMDTARHAIVEGVGIGQVAGFFASSRMRQGKLVPLLIGYTAPPIVYHLYMLRRDKIPKKTRILADYIYKELKAHPDFQPLKLEGALPAHLTA